MGKFVIKEVHSIKDVGKLSNIIYKNFIYLTSKPELQHNKEELTRLLTDENMLTYFVYENDKAVAYLVGEIKNLNDGRTAFYISYIFVAQKYRSKHIGSLLLKHVVKSIQSTGIKYILLTSDTADEKLSHFYEKFGFTIDPILRNNSRHEVFVLYL